ncbi:MAG: tRNA (adenosine(37)-N6)-threonylcarbamoyltransferase complex dimerization subunit type 1 TsaB [Gammaproteobacteria bacterium]|nr:tRNA (adenosine(37)-N6)-threonylcarbamoyltransferase complex dimerization subunit type 1 TsaB [Gammaproteobacteria bacterium]
MNILAIDTSTEACSAALLREDGAVFDEFEVAPRQHARLLPAMMDQVLQASAVTKPMISHCAFGNGPGAFTGIRIAASQAQGIGLALNIPLLPISTLAILAQVCMDRSGHANTLVALDARMHEIYWAVYGRDSTGCAELIGEEQLSPVNRVEINSTIEFGAGHGWVEALRESVSFPVDEALLPDARSLLKLAKKAINQDLGIDARRININYLRNRVAEKPRR